jgi:hypothetical protein
VPLRSRPQGAVRDQAGRGCVAGVRQLCGHLRYAVAQAAGRELRPAWLGSASGGWRPVVTQPGTPGGEVNTRLRRIRPTRSRRSSRACRTGDVVRCGWHAAPARRWWRRGPRRRSPPGRPSARWTRCSRCAPTTPPGPAARGCGPGRVGFHRQREDRQLAGRRGRAGLAVGTYDSAHRLAGALCRAGQIAELTVCDEALPLAVPAGGTLTISPYPLPRAACPATSMTARPAAYTEHVRRDHLTRP